MSAPHCIHLVAGERELLAECHRHRSYLTVCGELVPVSELPSSDCEEGCECEVVYCLDCLRKANERNYDAGADVDCPPGIIVRTDR